ARERRRRRASHARRARSLCRRRRRAARRARALGARPRGRKANVSAAPQVDGDEDLRRELAELRERVARRADVDALLARDGRTPLASIIGPAQPLQQRESEPSPQQRAQLLAVINREADRLAALLAEAFDTARIDTDTLTYVFADVDVAELVA